MPELFIGGTWTAAADGRTREIRCPADGTLVATVDEAGPKDAAAAITAARDAFDSGPWPSTPAAERGRLLLRVADLLERDKDALARAESLDTGKRLVESEYDMDDIADCFRYFGNLTASGGSDRIVDTGNPDTDSRVVHEPVGVCALITPWNYPLLQTSWKVAPALGAGNTFVLKPSELTPHTSIILMRLLTEAGLPDGAANLVLGAGPGAGAPLSEDPRVDLVSFTGGLVTGRRIMAAAAPTVKKIALELGGKNPNIVFADADFDAAVDYALMAVFLHSGQVCSAGARLLVQEELHDRFVDEVVVQAKRIRLGGPFDENARTGPLISAAHREKVAAYVAAGLADGAVLRCGGAPPTTRPCATASTTCRPCWTHAHRACPWCTTSRSARCSPSRRSATRTKRWRSPTTPFTDWPEPSGRRTSAGPTGWRPGCAPEPCGSTTSIRTYPRRSGAE